MFERLTDRARKVMAMANQEAQSFNHKYIGTEHILLGLVKEGSGVGVNALKNLDVDLRTVRLEVEKLVKSGPDLVTVGKLSQTPRAKEVVEYAIEEARNLNHNYVGTEHLLLGLLREHDGVAAQVLMNLGLKLEEVREEVLSLVGAGGNSERKESPNTRAEPPGGFANLLGKARAADGKAAHPGAFPASITATPAALDRLSFAALREHMSPGSDGSLRMDVDPDIARSIIDSRGRRTIELVIDVSPDPLRELRISLKRSE